MMLTGEYHNTQRKIHSSVRRSNPGLRGKILTSKRRRHDIAYERETSPKIHETILNFMPRDLKRGSTPVRLLGIAGSKPAGSTWVLCVVKYSSLRRTDRASTGVLPSVVCLSIISKPQQWRYVDPLQLSSHEKKRTRSNELYAVVDHMKHCASCQTALHLSHTQFVRCWELNTIGAERRNFVMCSLYSQVQARHIRTCRQLNFCC